MRSDLLQTTALRTTLNLESILAELSQKKVINFQNSNEKDRVVYIFHSFEVNKDKDKIDMGYEVMSPSIIEGETVLFPYPLEEDLFSDIDINNDLDNTRQLEAIINFLKDNGINTIFTGLLPEDEYFMGTNYAFENYFEDSITYLEPLNSANVRKQMNDRGLRLINCGDLPKTSSNTYLN